MKNCLRCFVLSTALIFVIAAAGGEDAVVVDTVSAEARARAAFASYETRFSKRYADDTEHSRRFELYKKRVATWPELRAQFPDTGFGETMFTDMTDEERARYIGGPIPPSLSELYDPATSRAAAEPSPARPHGNREKRATPTNWNWCDSTNNKCPPIENQGSCGSCWIFGGMAALEINNAIATGNIYSLSKEQPCNCNTDRGGVCCCGGWPSAYFGDIHEYTLASLYPYTFINADDDCSNDQKTCQPKPTYVAISGYESPWLPTTDIEDYIYNKGPFGCCVYVDNGFYDYTSGYISCTSDTSQYDCSHLITLVGFGVDTSGNEYYIGRNSWGTNWGINGYFKVKKSYSCYIGEYAGVRPHVIPFWKCPAANYNTSDGCHCGCGAYDPDCGKSGQTLIGCSSGQVCTTSGTCCTPDTCSTLGYNCGTYSDGCTDTISCGSCGTGQTCHSGTCCTPDTCASLDKFCGSWSDNCGDNVNCGSCESNEDCINGVCVCVPGTCSSLNFECGLQTDGCSGNLSCGNCTDPTICMDGLCKNCTPTTCAAMGKNCGTWSDGCITMLNCGSCLAGMVCGSNGVCTQQTTGSSSGKGGGGLSVTAIAGIAAVAGLLVLGAAGAVIGFLVVKRRRENPSKKSAAVPNEPDELDTELHVPAALSSAPPARAQPPPPPPPRATARAPPPPRGGANRPPPPPPPRGGAARPPPPPPRR